jgi:hypothetical protein
MNKEMIMPNENDLERLERLLGVSEDLAGDGLMKFQGSLTGISRLSPTLLRQQKTITAKPTNDQENEKKK